MLLQITLKTQIMKLKKNDKYLAEDKIYDCVILKSQTSALVGRFLERIYDL